MPFDIKTEGDLASIEAKARSMKSSGQPAVLSIADLMALDVAPPSMLIDGLLPGSGASLLFGAPKSNKTLLAVQMAIAVASGHPLFDNYRSRDEIRALAARLLTVQEEERRNLSRELHDQVCQNLVGLAMQVAALATKPPPPKETQTRLKAIQASIFKAAEEARDLAYQVHSPILDELGLMIALEDLHLKFTEQHPDIPVDLKNAGLPVAVPREVASCIFRVAQESLQNIAKHSNAKNVSVALGFENGTVVLTIGDDGVGFDLRAVKGRKGLGLIGMDERARLVKGKLTITAQPAHGTQITLEIPLHVGNS
jgi:signal transduction histidine kinase